MSTGENETGLRKILDFTRLGSMFILLLHFYFYCYAAFRDWKLTLPLTDRLLTHVAHTGLFSHFNNAKYVALGLLLLSLVGSKGKKDEKKKLKTLLWYAGIGLIIYFLSSLIFYL